MVGIRTWALRLPAVCVRADPWPLCCEHAGWAAALLGQAVVRVPDHFQQHGSDSAERQGPCGRVSLPEDQVRAVFQHLVASAAGAFHSVIDCGVAHQYEIKQRLERHGPVHCSRRTRFAVSRDPALVGFWKIGGIKKYHGLVCAAMR